MALTALTAACVSIVSAFNFGGPSGKKRKMVTAILNDPDATSGGATVGANVDDIPVSIFGLTKVESVSALQIYTTSTGAPVRIYSAAPDLAGTSIILSDSGQAAGAKADMTLATSESAQITVVGY